ncbi:MAG: hypothetical protein IJV16_09620 [Lachnospiraceae bacterium]|nr:hypothetical protein [Lachnospiraceae bacterium]
MPNVWKIMAAVCMAAAIIMCYRFINIDNAYKFDLSYLEKNPDSLVVNCFNLRKGSFELVLEYDTASDVRAYVQADNDNAFDLMLTSGEKSVKVPFSLAHPTDRFKITIPADEGAGVSINGISLISDRFPIYTDSLLYAVLWFLAGIVIIAGHRKWTGLSDQDKKDLIILMILIIAVNIPYYQKGLGFTADIRAHMQRIEGIMRGLMDHQFPVVVSPNMMNEFGELSFLYPDTFLYPFGILRIFFVSMLTAYRLCMFFSNILTVILAYAAFRLMCRDRRVVLLATLCITFEPYRLYNILGRGSGAGNVIASAFLPLVIAGVWLILKGDRRWWVLSAGMTGVIQSHVMTLVILTISLILLAVFMIKDLAHRQILLSLLKSASLALLMNLGFLLIFMKCYLTDWDPSALEWSIFTDSGYGITEALANPWSLFEIVGIMACILLLARFQNKKNMAYRLSLALTVTGAILYVTTWKLFPWGILISISPAIERFTTMLQVPQRVLAVSSVFLISSIAMSIGKPDGETEADPDSKSAIYGGFTGVLFVAVGLVLTYGTIVDFEDYYSSSCLMPDEVYGDFNSLPIKDYIPSGVTDESWRSDMGYVSDEDAVESVSYFKYGTHIDYTYISHADGTYADMPLLYYEWYRAKDENGDALDTWKAEDGRVAVSLRGDGMQHEAHIWFDMGIVYSILYVMSLSFTLVFIASRIYHKPAENA